MSDTSENAVKNNVIKSYVDLHPRYKKIEEVDVPDYNGDDIWAVENGVLVTNYDLHVRGNAIIDGDTSSSGEGTDVTTGINEEQLMKYLDDNKYVTESDVNSLIPVVDLTPYATKDEVSKEIADLINSAPTTLDTLGEIALAFAESQDVVQALDQAIGQKANQSALESLTMSVSSLQATIDRINAWYSTLANLIIEENGKVRIQTDIIIDGDMASA